MWLEKNEAFILSFLHVCRTRDRTQDLVHARQALYHWVTTPSIPYLFYTNLIIDYQIVNEGKFLFVEELQLVNLNKNW
jgi:hypothetical protein